MSKPMTRVVISVLISLAVLAAIYTVVLAGSSGNFLAMNQLGSHPVSGARVNLDHYRLSVADQALYQAQLDAYNAQSQSGHNCNSSQAINPDD